MELQEVDGLLVDKEKCHWNLNKNSVVHNKPITLWGVLNFSTCSLERFFLELISHIKKLDIHMEEPLFCNRY